MTDAGEPVTIATLPNEFEAHLLVAALAADGIEAIAFPLSRGVLPIAIPGRPEANRVPVQVRAHDADRARVLVAAHRDNPDAVDWDTVDVGERVDHVPLHRAGRVPWLARIAISLAILLLIASIVAGLAMALTVA